ncbi:MAG: hypothetical protein ACT4P6_03240 [Gemmatimonadaceae bacterium]
MNITGIARQLMGATSFVVGLAALGSAAPAMAQDVDSRWQPWLGCWEAIDTDSDGYVTKKPRICVIPTSTPSTVEIVSMVFDSVALRQRIDASGEQRSNTKDGCTGWERAQWSSNGQRLYLRSSHTCAGGLTRLSNGVMAMSTAGRWLDVLGVVAGTTQGVRVAQYRDVTGEGSLPSEISTALAGRWSRLSDARIAAMAPLTTQDVVEASRFLDPGVVQAWLAERGEGFALNANRLVELEKAGVPSVVIDVMVALSYPQVFALNRSRVEGATGESVTQGAAGGGRALWLYGWDPFYSPYGYRYGYGYGYGHGYGGWYYGNRPVVIVRQPNKDETRHGRVSKDRGYTPGSGAPRRGGSAEGSSGSSGSSGSAGSASSGGASSKSPSSGSGSSSGSGRTAKPRPPG